MSRILVLMLMISTYALASEHEHTGTDIVQRTVNFLLFAGLVWYLIGEPVKNFFASRSQAIADELKKVQDRLNESIALKKEALAQISEAEKFAQELAATTKKENKILNDTIVAQAESDIAAMVKKFALKKEFEEKKMVRSVVEDVIKETLKQSGDSFDRKTMANIILKKVA